VPALHLSNVVKDYHGLRPLRVQRFTLEPGTHAAIVGFDQHSAEMMINLVTGATLPDSGEIEILNQASAAIRDGDEWLALVNRFGIVSERAVILDSMSVVQNLAMPFSLDVEPPSAALRAKAIALAEEAGIAEADRDRPLAEVAAAARLRVRVARALALDPEIVILEHPSATLPRSDVRTIAQELRGVLQGRSGLTSLTLTADVEFAEHVAPNVFTLDPATGRVDPLRRGWFGGRRR
jgi:ABC-type transporter Mla maintaining outer membrane lipid asymmetry ATPase subunit MlaF